MKARHPRLSSGLRLPDDGQAKEGSTQKAQMAADRREQAISTARGPAAIR